MNRDTLKGQWTQIKGKVREQWGKLTDDDLDQMQGNAEQLIGKLQERYGEESRTGRAGIRSLARPAGRAQGIVAE
jgi:uncharacterized protein YjbJ (UPF0337 family)